MESEHIPVEGGTQAVTSLLARYSSGDSEALNSLLPLIYSELRKLAASYMRRENSGHTLQPTALVHEAFFRLVGQENVEWKNRSHFFGIAAQMMRRILVDHARAKQAEKRGGGETKLSFDEAFHVAVAGNETPDLVAIDTALTALTELDPRQAKVVELRYFAGLSVEETAQVLDTSPATVKRDWALAKAWLYKALHEATQS